MQTGPEKPQINRPQDGAEAKPAGNSGEPGSQSAGGSLADQRTSPAQAVWNHVAQRRFKHLAVKEALATITEEELSELESLTTLRRREVAAKASAANLADCIRLTRPPAANVASGSPNSGR